MIERGRQSGVGLGITLRHVNRIRVKWGYSRPKGRPKGQKNIGHSDTGQELVKLETDLPFVGVHMFAERIENRGGFVVGLPILRKAIEAWCAENPDESFPLVNRSDVTLMLRFKALFYAPLLGI